jgi:hypothetical protein
MVLILRTGLHTQKQVPLTHHWPEKSADHAWCGAEMAPSITHIIAGSKPSAWTSSPHHGRSSLRLVWAWDIVCLRRTVSYDTAKSVRFIYTTIYTAPHSPPPTLLSVIRRRNNRSPQSPMHCLIVVFCFVAPLRLERSSWMRARCIVALLPLPPCHLPYHVVG